MNQIKIPKTFFDVHYKSARVPGVENQSDLSFGANCQVFAYALLKENGLQVPNDRSSELWSDTSYSVVVNDFEPLDLMLYSASGDSYGAHVGVYIGNGEVLHLSFQNGKPEIISHKSLMMNEKYHCFVGAKRVLNRHLDR
jgi:cell wall-associated NlpC family hydrolase